VRKVLFILLQLDILCTNAVKVYCVCNDNLPSPIFCALEFIEQAKLATIISQEYTMDDRGNNIW